MPENTRPLSSDLVSKLRIDILTERMHPGEKLTEHAVSNDYGVSRTPVREAFKNLEAEGLVEMIPNRGAFVVGLSKSDIHDIYILRMQSEMQAVRWAVERRTEEELEAIEESFDFMRFYTERRDAKRMHSINSGFHSLIAAASHNRILIESLSRIQDYIRYSAHVFPYHESVLETLLSEHKEVIAAFRSNDTEAGAVAMKKHIENSLMRAQV